MEEKRKKTRFGKSKVKSIKVKELLDPSDKAGRYDVTYLPTCLLNCVQDGPAR